MNAIISAERGARSAERGKTSRLLSALALCFILAAKSVAFAQSAEVPGDEPSKSAGRSQDRVLDDELLGGLADDPVEGLEDAKDDAKPAGHPQSRNELDDELLRGLDDGEDIKLDGMNLDGGQDPLSDISGRMREVERSIAEADAGEGTQGKQRAIAEEMEKLIRQLQKQCQAGKQASSKHRKTAGRGKVGQPDQADRGSDQPARDSSDRLNDEKTKKPDAAAMGEMVKAAWGHLPDHLREQMAQMPTPEFLPKYLILIEDYYKALAKPSERDRR